MDKIPSFNSFVEQSIKDNWERDALTDYKGATLQFHDVARKIEKLHILFENSELQRGDKVALCGRNSSNWAVVPAFLLHPLQPDFDVLLKPVVLSNLLFLAVLASLVCYVLWNVVLKQLGTVRASNYIYLNPLVTMVASIIILHKQITWITLLGAGCIIFGVYQAEKKWKSKTCI